MTADTPPPVTAPVACVDRPESRAYVAAVKERAYSRWTPSVEDPAGNAVIRFRLDAQGQVLSAEMLSTTSDGVGRSAEEALVAGAPYPPMPPEAQCLARLRLIATFKTPEAQAPARQREPEPDPREWWKMLRPFIPPALLLVGFVLERAGRRRKQASNVPEETAPQSPIEPLRQPEWTRYAVVAGAVAVAIALLFWLAS